MKILVIGNRWHQLITNYVNALRNATNSNYTIDVLSYDYDKKKYQTDNSYNSIFTLAFPLAKYYPKYLRITIQHFLLRKRLKDIQGNYDVIHIHYLENFLLRDANRLSQIIKTPLLITLWGADSRVSKRKSGKHRRWFERADGITLATNEMVESFFNVFEENEFKDKIIECKFGLQPLFWIEKHWNESREDIKKLIGLPSNHYIVTIGHNARREQRHPLIIESIENNSKLDALKDKLCFILMLTYPHDDKYISEINNIISKSKFRFVVIDHFLSEEEIAYYRMTTDFFIQLETNDVLSGSMVEYMSCNSVVITGSWLPYQTLDKLNIKYYVVDDINEISTRLHELLMKYEDVKLLTVHNHDVIMNEFKWDSLINNWIKAYDYILQN